MCCAKRVNTEPIDSYNVIGTALFITRNRYLLINAFTVYVQVHSPAQFYSMGTYSSVQQCKI